MKTIDFSKGYLRPMDPAFVEVQFYMYGEDWNTPYCPVEFR